MISLVGLPCSTSILWFLFYHTIFYFVKQNQTKKVLLRIFYVPKKWDIQDFTSFGAFTVE